MSEILERKLGFLNRYISDLSSYAALDSDERLREHDAMIAAVDPAIALYRAFADWSLQQLKVSAEQRECLRPVTCPRRDFALC